MDIVSGDFFRRTDRGVYVHAEQHLDGYLEVYNEQQIAHHQGPRGRREAGYERLNWSYEL
jgi:hypothetical protein